MKKKYENKKKYINSNEDTKSQNQIKDNNKEEKSKNYRQIKKIISTGGKTGSEINLTQVTKIFMENRTFINQKNAMIQKIAALYQKVNSKISSISNVTK